MNQEKPYNRCLHRRLALSYFSGHLQEQDQFYAEPY